MPVPSPFQYPLPAGPANQAKANWDMVRADVMDLIHPDMAVAGFPGDVDAGGEPYYGAMFVQLAYLCAATFRRTDYLGGCNGARIRYYTGWPINAGLDNVLSLLTNLQQSKYKDTVSLSDLIVFAGNVALEDAAGQTGWLPFCPGRVDVASNDGGWDNLQAYTQPISYNTTDSDRPFGSVRRAMDLMNLTVTEYVALMGRPRSAQLMGLQKFTAKTWSVNPAHFSNEYYNTLLNMPWTSSPLSNGLLEYQYNNKLFMTPSDLNLIGDHQEDYFLIAQNFAYDLAGYQTAFASAWTKLMNADRFDTLCSAPAAASSTAAAKTPVTSQVWFVAVVSAVGTAIAAGALFFCIRRQGAKSSDDSVYTKM
jgi:hypothetical protein